MSLEDVKVGRCDFKQYEHCGLHERIPSIGQRLPPFGCANWQPEAAEREQAAPPEHNGLVTLD